MAVSIFYSTFAPVITRDNRAVKAQKYIGEMAEWSNAVVLKTIVRQRTGGSNPSLSAMQKCNRKKSLVNLTFTRLSSFSANAIKHQNLQYNGVSKGVDEKA